MNCVILKDVAKKYIVSIPFCAYHSIVGIRGAVHLWEVFFKKRQWYCVCITRVDSTFSRYVTCNCKIDHSYAIGNRVRIFTHLAIM